MDISFEMMIHRMTFPDCSKTIARTHCSNENPLADCSNPTSTLKIMDMSTFLIRPICKGPAFEQSVRPCKMYSRYIHRMPFDGSSFRRICPFRNFSCLDYKSSWTVRNIAEPWRSLATVNRDISTERGTDFVWRRKEFFFAKFFFQNAWNTSRN